MDDAEIRSAERLARARIETAGGEVESIVVIRKSRDAYLATVDYADRDGAEQMVVTRAELEAAPPR